MDLLHLGLLIVTAAWLVQLFYLLRGERKLKSLFVAVYMVGAAVISFASGWDIYQLATMIAAGAVLASVLMLRG